MSVAKGRYAGPMTADFKPLSGLPEYLARIGLEAAPSVDPYGLARLQEAHRRAIAFENLDIPLGRPIRIDSESVFEKLVRKRRGGYCFEQNRLFCDMLTDIGFVNRPLLARVRLGLPEGVTPPRTHMLLLADLDGRHWTADAGFGGTYVPPLPLADGAEANTPDGARHRLRRIGESGSLSGEWLLERAGPAAATDGRAAAHGGWQAQYSFDLGEVAPEDLEQCNHWTSTRPGTRFTSLCIASRVLEAGFAALTDRQLTVFGEAETRVIANAGDYRECLARVFGIDLSAEEVEALPIFAAGG